MTRDQMRSYSRFLLDDFGVAGISGLDATILCGAPTATAGRRSTQTSGGRSS
jgi:hypothetical protein